MQLEDHTTWQSFLIDDRQSLCKRNAKGKLVNKHVAEESCGGTRTSRTTSTAAEVKKNNSEHTIDTTGEIKSDSKSEVKSDPNGENINPSPLLNILTAGSALQARYSEYHTMRVQLIGATRYYLFPPHTVASHMHLYPSIHRCAQQSQVRWSVYFNSANEPC